MVCLIVIGAFLALMTFWYIKGVIADNKTRPSMRKWKNVS